MNNPFQQDLKGDVSNNDSNNKSDYNNTKAKYVENSGIYKGTLKNFSWKEVKKPTIKWFIKNRRDDVIIKVKTTDEIDLSGKFAQIIYVDDNGVEFLPINDNNTVIVEDVEHDFTIKFAFDEANVRKQTSLEETIVKLKVSSGNIEAEVFEFQIRSLKILKPLFLVDGYCSIIPNYEFHGNEDRDYKRYKITNSSYETTDFIKIEPAFLNRLGFTVPNTTGLKKRPYDLKEESELGIRYEENKRLFFQFYNFVNFFTDYDNSLWKEFRDKIPMITVTEDNISNFGIISYWDKNIRRSKAFIKNNSVVYKEELGEEIYDFCNKNFWYVLYDSAIKIIMKDLPSLKTKPLEICVVQREESRLNKQTNEWVKKYYIQFPKRTQIFRHDNLYKIDNSLFGYEVEPGKLQSMVYKGNLKIIVDPNLIEKTDQHVPTKYHFALSKQELQLEARSIHLKNEAKKAIAIEPPVNNQPSPPMNNIISDDEDLPI